MQHWEIKRLQGDNNHLLNFFRASLCQCILHHKLGWNIMFWAWMFLFFFFLFCTEKVTEVAFLVYSKYLVKVLNVLRKEDYGCFAEKYRSLPFIFIMNLVKPSKTQIIWINITVICWKNTTFLSFLIHTWTCFLAEFEAHLWFLLMIFFVSVFAHGMNSKGLLV